MLGRQLPPAAEMAWYCRHANCLLVGGMPTFDVPLADPLLYSLLYNELHLWQVAPHGTGAEQAAQVLAQQCVQVAAAGGEGVGAQQQRGAAAVLSCGRCRMEMERFNKTGMLQACCMVFMLLAC